MAATRGRGNTCTGTTGKFRGWTLRRRGDYSGIEETMDNTGGSTVGDDSGALEDIDQIGYQRKRPRKGILRQTSEYNKASVPG